MGRRETTCLVAGCALLVAIGAGGSTASAALGDLLLTINDPAPTTNDLFGQSVAALGKNMLVGAPYARVGGYVCGAVYLFDGQTGALLRTFQDPAPAHQDYFGCSVAAVGNNVLVGAYEADAKTTNAGAAYLFNGSTGELLQTFYEPSPNANNWFGQSVAAVGNNVLVGCRCADKGATNTGAAYLFNGSTGGLIRTFTNPTPGYADYFGCAVAAAGNNIIAGAYGEDAGASNAGAAYLIDGTTGDLIQTFSNPTPAQGDEFGSAVAAAGNDVLVGTMLDGTNGTSAGAAYLFDGQTGLLRRTFLGSGVGCWFGCSVAALGNDLLVGANHQVGSTGGAVYLFDGSTGDLLHTFQEPEPKNSNRFGYSVAAAGGDVLIAADHDDGAATGIPAVYLFEGLPEPATLWLLTLGAIAAIRRRRPRFGA
jgi:hypothetical protein